MQALLRNARICQRGTGGRHQQGRPIRISDLDNILNKPVRPDCGLHACTSIKLPFPDPAPVCPLDAPCGDS
jgi:hypothetical protein